MVRNYTWGEPLVVVQLICTRPFRAVVMRVGGSNGRRAERFELRAGDVTGVAVAAFDGR